MNEQITSSFCVDTRDASEDFTKGLSIYKTLYDVLQGLDLLDERIVKELESGKEYWNLERQLCKKICEGGTVNRRVMS